jgi:hypothetical protein
MSAALAAVLATSAPQAVSASVVTKRMILAMVCSRMNETRYSLWKSSNRRTARPCRK